MDRTLPAIAALAAVSLCLLFLPGTALADAIDGTWCAVDGRIMEIHGSAITTPGGNDIAGNYGRHSFSYVVPPGETPAGETVRMVLWNEDIVHLKVGEQAGEAEVWQRCDTVS
jgi:hypothetical protein